MSEVTNVRVKVSPCNMLSCFKAGVFGYSSCSPIDYPKICASKPKKVDKKNLELTSLVIEKSGVYDGYCIKGFKDDGVHIKNNNVTVKNCLIFDTFNRTNKAGGHRDGVQIIPPPNQGDIGFCHYNQMIGGQLSNVFIEKNYIYGRGAGEGSLQGVFSSDGIFKNLRVNCNVFDTLSAPHRKIAINGIMSGSIKDNRLAVGDMPQIELRPVRIGGGSEDGKSGIWIMSFKSKNYKYLPVLGLSDNEEVYAKNCIENDKKVRAVYQRQDKLINDVKLYVEKQLKLLSSKTQAVEKKIKGNINDSSKNALLIELRRLKNEIKALGDKRYLTIFDRYEIADQVSFQGLPIPKALSRKTQHSIQEINLYRKQISKVQDACVSQFIFDKRINGKGLYGKKIYNFDLAGFRAAVKSPDAALAFLRKNKLNELLLDMEMAKKKAEDSGEEFSLSTRDVSSLSSEIISYFGIVK